MHQSLEHCEDVIALQISSLDDESQIQDSKPSILTQQSEPYDQNDVINLRKDSKSITSTKKQGSESEQIHSKSIHSGCEVL